MYIRQEETIVIFHPIVKKPASFLCKLPKINFSQNFII